MESHLPLTLAFKYLNFKTQFVTMNLCQQWGFMVFTYTPSYFKTPLEFYACDWITTLSEQQYIAKH